MTETVSYQPETEMEPIENQNAPNQSFTVCGYTFGEHASSGVPVHYLTVLLKYFLPYDYVYDQSLKQTIESQFAENLLELKFGFNSELASANVTGSKSEGLALPDYTSRNESETTTACDRMNIIGFANSFEVEETIEQSLELESSDEPQPKNSKAKTGNIMELQMFPGLPKNCTGLKLTSDFVEGFNIQNVLSMDSKLHKTFLEFDERCLHSSKGLQKLVVNLQCQSESAVSEQGSQMTEPNSNTMLAIRLKEWPEIANKWTSRSRTSDWPQEQFIKQITSKGVHLLPIRDTENCKNVWIYSFFLAETTLAQLLSRDQRKCFMILKLLFEHFFHEPEVFSAYHLKTFFLWICEFIPPIDFRDTHLGCTLLTVLETLCDVIRKRELDHYFIDEINLLSDTPPERAHDLSQRVRWVIENIIQCVVKIDNNITFSSVLNNREKLSVLFASAIHSCEMSPKEPDEFVSSVHDGLIETVRSYMDVCKQIHSQDSEHDQALTWNVMTDLFREILIDMRDFQDIPESMHNMDFMLGCLVSVRKDPNLIAQIYMYLCTRANLKDKTKMISILNGVLNRAGSIPLLRGKQFVLAAMMKILEQPRVPTNTELNNQALYMQSYKELLIDEMLGSMALS